MRGSLRARLPSLPPPRTLVLFMTPSLFFVTGVCGVGKTSVIPQLKLLLPSDQFRIHDLDERGVPDGGGRDWRLAETQYWMDVAAKNAEAGLSTVVCGFANPEELGGLKLSSNLKATYILLDADEETIRQRLAGRYTDAGSEAEVQRATNDSLETFIQNNVSFSSVLREICRQQSCAIVDTKSLEIEEVADQIAYRIVKSLKT